MADNRPGARSPGFWLMLLDHIGFRVRNVEASKRFYLAALAPLGVGVAMEGPFGVGLGRDGKPQLWLSRANRPPRRSTLPSPREIAPKSTLSTPPRLAAGGKDNGPPGLRPHYHPNYYGAFAIDPDGHNIEAVCHSPAR